jgi:hypothetical protein
MLERDLRCKTRHPASKPVKNGAAHVQILKAGIAQPRENDVFAAGVVVCLLIIFHPLCSIGLPICHVRTTKSRASEIQATHVSAVEPGTIKVEDLRAGRAGWPAELERVVSGTNRTSIASMRMPLFGTRICSSSNRSLPAIRPWERFLTELTLDPPDATSDQAGVPLLDEDYLILSTIHSSKGQEWKSVFILNVIDGCIPSDLATGTTDELEEERRLLYVAMTRAKDDLHLLIPQRFFVHGQSPQGDRHLYASRTRFIPDALLQLFERVSWPVAAEGAHNIASQGPRVDIAARMRERWR